MDSIVFLMKTMDHRLADHTWEYTPLQLDFLLKITREEIEEKKVEIKEEEPPRHPLGIYSDDLPEEMIGKAKYLKGHFKKMGLVK